MPLHLMKLCVGATSIADLEDYIAEKLAAARKAKAKAQAEHIHTTRMVPKRIDEILAGGSLFWVIKGQIAVRQKLLDIRPITGDDGIGRCQLFMDPEVVAVMPRPCRPFQGWRYLPDDRKPADLGGVAGAVEMPEHLRYALRELCLI